MSRLPRIDVPGLPQHVVLRGNNRMDIFADDIDRHAFIKFVREGLDEEDCRLHSYVLMSNHVHLLVTARHSRGLSRLMQSVGRRFAKLVNRRRSRTGTLFEGRFRSSLVDCERYFLACMRYVECNPVRAAVVARPSDYRWSSHLENASGEPGGIITAHDVYLGLGSNAPERRAAYVALFENAIPRHELESIRASVQKNRAVGGPDFIARWEKELGRSVKVTPHGGARGGSGEQVI